MGFRLPPLLAETLTLQTPRGRLLVFVVLSLVVFISPYGWLAHLSLWQAVGLDQVPSVGLTRAYWLLLHGDPSAAWERNNLIYVVLVIGLPLMFRDLWRLLRPKAGV